MDTPSEPQRGRIIAFPQVPDQRANGGDDRIVAESPSRTQSPGMTHLRALPLGVSSGAFFPGTPTEEVPARAAALGVHTVEVMLQTPGEYQPAFIAEVAARARDADVTVRSVHTMHRLHPLFSPYDRAAREARELFDRGIEAATMLGAEVLVWHGAGPEVVRAPEGWDRFIALTTELAAACGDAGVTLGLENVSWCALATVRDIARFAGAIDDIGPPEHVGFVFDPFQAMRADANPFMMLAAMGNRLVDVHISDYSSEHPERNHLPPGAGNIPWSALLRAIAGGGYRGPLVIESPLGEGSETLDGIRAFLEPRIRAMFDFSPGNTISPELPAHEPTQLPDGVREGIALFNQRQFYDAHEVIEHEWHAERGPVRRLYQGILQIGVGFYQALNGNHRGAVLLLTDGLDKTAGFTPGALGVDTGRLVAEATTCLDAIRALAPDEIDRFDPDTIPFIHLDGPDEPAP